MVKGLEFFIKEHGIKSRNIGGHKFLVLYKTVRRDFGSIYFTGIYGGGIRIKEDKGAYLPDMVVRCRKCNTRRDVECGAGLNVASFKFAKDFSNGSRKRLIVEVLVRPSDVVCVPLPYNPGKIRCKRLKVVRVVDKRKGP